MTPLLDFSHPILNLSYPASLDARSPGHSDRREVDVQLEEAQHEAQVGVRVVEEVFAGMLGEWDLEIHRFTSAG